MTTDKKVYIGDVGTVIDVDCGESISGATSCALSVLKPNGARVEWSATIHGTSVLRHIVVAGDLDVAGTYRLQPMLTLGTWAGRGNTVSFDVWSLFT